MVVRVFLVVARFLVFYDFLNFMIHNFIYTHIYIIFNIVYIYTQEQRSKQ